VTRPPNARGARAVAVLVLAGSVLVAAVSCSLPPDDRVNRIAVDDLGQELANTTTTSTTTTLPPTTVPSTEPGATAPETSSTTTTTLEIPTQRQRLYYTLGGSEDIEEVTLPLTDDASYATLRNELESPRTEVRALRLATAVRPGLVEGFEFDPDTVTLTVALDGSTFGDLTESQRRRAIGQIVLTYTVFAPRDSGAAGFVNFTIDGEPISVTIPRTGSLSDPGQPLTYNDFRAMLGDAGTTPSDTGPPATDPPTTSPPTSPPPTDGT
jgi:hypothetical protein